MVIQRRILILGAGWLGLPLASTLTQHGDKVIVTRRHWPDEILQTSKHALIYESLDLAQADAFESLTHLIRHHKITHIIGSFPPGFRQGGGQDYAKFWLSIARAARDSAIQKLVMISSTSVYDQPTGTMDESCANPASNGADLSKSAILLAAEHAVINSGIPYCVIRCSGLFGPQRHPARFIHRLKQVSRVAPANMLHLDDAIDIICFLLSHPESHLVNATTPETVSKAAFYRAAAEQHTQISTQIAHNDEPGKRISATKLLSLGYQFHFNSTLDALKALSSRDTQTR
ncbi:NAD-dependent epimerase/dehydratase family protein [Vibrio sp. SM6]|uniref:NAD-dependent epimerase/dehydratase family protein n=1 Tax=Vibrio agarilyticus TaxID=2726741 RepID=A0A7X8TME5_9VIBR|nr:NAD-dependent epimerase/dehydratase family protein [Vibrio agarilyticus]NLS11427.1 NAD-dependent epimerase/dehydratase family protein [Vibrio agarilyticus]